MFCDKVTKALYSNYSDPVGLADPQGKAAITRLLAAGFDELKSKLGLDISSTQSLQSCMPSIFPDFEEVERELDLPRVPTPQPLPTLLSCDADSVAVNTLYLRAAALHQHLSVFFDSPDTSGYRENLLALWGATKAFLEGCYTFDTSGGNLIVHATNYILQMIIAAGFTLLKLLNSFFASFIDMQHGKDLFTRAIATIRKISVMREDLPSRLAEVLAQMWRAGQQGNFTSSLEIKVRCRMSMSLVYDSVWRWREEFEAKGRGNLDCMRPLYPATSISSLPIRTVS
jgi:hypothetical protein